MQQHQLWKLLEVVKTSSFGWDESSCYLFYLQWKYPSYWTSVFYMFQFPTGNMPSFLAPWERRWRAAVTYLSAMLSASTNLGSSFFWEQKDWSDILSSSDIFVVTNQCASTSVVSCWCKSRKFAKSTQPNSYKVFFLSKFTTLLFLHTILSSSWCSALATNVANSLENIIGT